MRNVSILGSTGSVGTNTLNVVRAFPERFRVTGLAAGKNVVTLAEQGMEFRPRIVSVQDQTTAEALVSELRARGASYADFEIVWDTEGAAEVATHPDAHIVLG